MSYLLVDTGQGLTLGLADKKWKWKEFVRTQTTKNSNILYAKINDILTKEGIAPQELSGLIIGSGPGSYTGVRLSEGLAQVWEWAGVETYSYYHFELPYLCNHSSGLWYSKAFKGEMFCHHWEGEKVEQKLVTEDEFYQLANTSTLFTLEFDSEDIVSTVDLLEKQPDVLLPKIWERKKRLGPFYYRTPEKEFRPSMK